MDFKNDPIAKEVEKIMWPLSQKAELKGSQYNRVFEAVYELQKRIMELKKRINTPKDYPPYDLRSQLDKDSIFRD